MLGRKEGGRRGLICQMSDQKLQLSNNRMSRVTFMCMFSSQKETKKKKNADEELIAQVCMAYTGVFFFFFFFSFFFFSFSFFFFFSIDGSEWGPAKRCIVYNDRTPEAM